MVIVYPPLSDEEWPDEIADMRDDFAGRLNVYRVMAHHPALVRAWADFRNHVVVNNVLGQKRSEVVILRAGYRMNASYEWNHHVSRARACGIQDDRIETIRGATEKMRAEDAVLARAVDALIDEKRLPDETHAELSALVGKQGVFDVIATVGLYSMLGYIVRSFDTPLDDDVARELSGASLAMR